MIQGLTTAARRPMVVDSPACAPEPSKRVYGIDPAADATHTNGTPRDLAVTGTGSDQVRLALVACGNVTEDGDELAYTPPRPPEYGGDPHSHPRSDPNARVQKSEFLRIGGKVS